MYRQAVRPESFYLIQCMLHFRDILTWKAHDQIHVNVVKPGFSCQMKCIFCLLYRMTSADDIQGLLIHGLRIYGNSGNRKFPDCLKFLQRNTIRSSCLNCKFLQFLTGKIFRDRAKKSPKLIRFQSGRCSTANINRIQFPIFHHLGNSLDFFDQCIQIIFYIFTPFFQWIGTERTVQTDTWTERNSHIKTVTVLIIDIFQDIPLTVGNGNCKGCFFRAYQILFSHISGDLCILHSGFQHTHRHFYRTDTRKISPWKCLSCSFGKHLIKGIFDSVFIFSAGIMGIIARNKGIRSFSTGLPFHHSPVSCLFLYSVIVTDGITFFITGNPEADIIIRIILLIKRSDLISGIKRFDQLIHIMFKISVLKQNANLIQMDYTSFRNQWLWMCHVPEIPLYLPAMRPQAYEDSLRSPQNFRPENRFFQQSHRTMYLR